MGAEGKVKGLMSVARDISKQKNNEKVLRSQLGLLRALRSIDNAVISTMDIKVTLDIFLEQVVTNLKIDAATVLGFNEGKETLKYVTTKGFRTSALKYTQLPLGETHAGRAATEKKIITIPDLRENMDGCIHAVNFQSENFVAYMAVPLISNGETQGVLELFHRACLEMDPDRMEFLEAIADQGAIAINNAVLFEELQHSNTELVHAYDAAIEGWSRAMDLRDKETEGHSRRVSEMTVRMARAMEMQDEDIAHARRGALLHDIGKMGIPDRILLKPGPLTEEEWKIIKLHPVYARDMLYPTEYLRPAIEIPYGHHERWDGTGYPQGLAGEAIPIAARIFTVVDVWDALRSDRPYRSAWPKEPVIAHIQSLSGTHFDPRAVELFLTLVDEAEEALLRCST
jgi:HD-GYP domain-containing protein (c-di-GMP phosphodiesterase class II)